MPQDKMQNLHPSDSSVPPLVLRHLPLTQYSQLLVCQARLCLTCWYTHRLLPSDQVSVHNCFLYTPPPEPTPHNQPLPALPPPLLLLQPLYPSMSVRYSWVHIHRCLV